jgi:8-oxo-dGTP diphosphatase
MQIGYHKVGLLTVRDGRILLCRKSRGTSLLILPGGCFEPGETAEACLTRELHEELGNVEVSGLAFIGTYRDVAAGDESKIVQIELFQGDLIGDPQPRSEIAELVWFGANDDRTELSPSIRRKVLPDLISRGILSWAHA